MGLAVTIVLGLIAALAGIAWGRRTGSVLMGEPIDIRAKNVDRWRSIAVPAAIIQGIPPSFAMAWIAVESQGNPCAIGEVIIKDNGDPQEMGLFQIYNPDDMMRIGIKPGELRAYCGTGTTRQELEHQIRSMTAEEMSRHILIGLAEIKHCKERADHYLSTNGMAWTPGNQDYWRAVKLWHALPGVMSPGFDQVRAKLGFGARSWQEFRTTYETIQPRAKFDASKGTHQDGYWRALENAERTGDFADPHNIGLV